MLFSIIVKLYSARGVFDTPYLVRKRAKINCDSGEWVIPRFQRYFDWKKEDVRDFLKSIFLDYYVGTPFIGCKKGDQTRTSRSLTSGFHNDIESRIGFKC